MSTNRWINLGCGGNRLPKPWENYDAEVDIAKPLPFPDGCAQFIFAEHVVEHITPAEAWGFFNEAYRVLRRDGVLRVAVPDIVRIWENHDGQYLEWLKASGFGDGTTKSAIQNIICNHGHKALWDQRLLRVVLSGVGFRRVFSAGVDMSVPYSPLRNIEGHGRVIGDHNNHIETTVVEAEK